MSGGMSGGGWRDAAVRAAEEALAAAVRTADEIIADATAAAEPEPAPAEDEEPRSILHDAW